jgi:ADP-heptose:LPS heptosyltransferase
MYKTALIFDLNFMGDMLQSSPVMRCLKQNGVQRVDVICYDFCEEVLKANPYVDNIYPVRNKLWVLYESILARLFFRYDLILQLNTSLITNIFMAVAGGRDRLGYNYRGLGILHTIRIPLKHRAHKGTTYRVRQNLELLEKGLGWTCENEEMIFDSNSTKPRS